MRHDSDMILHCFQFSVSRSQSVWIQELRKNTKELPQVTVKDIVGSVSQSSIVIGIHLFLSSPLLYHTSTPQWSRHQDNVGQGDDVASQKVAAVWEVLLHDLILHKSLRSAMTAWLVIGERTTTNDSYWLIGIPERARACTIRTSVGRQVLPISFASLHKTCADLSRTIYIT